MAPHQLLFGGVSLALGVLSLAASLSNHEGFFQLTKVRLLESMFGRNGARITCAALGCALIALGGLIVTGVLPRRW